MMMATMAMMAMMVMMVMIISDLVSYIYLLFQGIGLVWESYKLDPYVQRLAEAVFNFQEKVSKKSYF
jgi:dynein heavy chain 1